MKQFAILIFTLFITAFSSFNAKDKDVKTENQKSVKRDSLINVLIKSARIEEELNKVTKSLGKYNGVSQIKLEDYKEISEILKNSFQQDTMLNIIKRAFRKNYDENYINMVINWMNSPLSQKIFSLETNKFDTLSVEELQYMVASLPRTGRTINMVREMCKVTGVVDLTTNLVVDYLKSFINGVNSKLPKEKQVNPNSASFAKANLIKNLKPYIQLGAELVMYNKYKELSYAEYQEYINFYSSSYGSWFNRTQCDGFVKSFEYSSAKFIKNLMVSDIILNITKN